MMWLRLFKRTPKVPFCPHCLSTQLDEVAIGYCICLKCGKAVML